MAVVSRLTALLRVRVHRQAWARSRITQMFANGFQAEPLGWYVPGTGVFDHAVPGSFVGRVHRGVDFGLEQGTPVTAALGGRVTFAGWSDLGYGWLVAVEGGRYICRYAHLERVAVVVGQRLKAGAVLGRSGSSGNSTGPHLHFECYDKFRGCYIDPLTA